MTPASAAPGASVRSASIDVFFEVSLLGLVASGYLALLGSGYLDPVSAVTGGLGIVLRTLAVAGVIRLRMSGPAAAALVLAIFALYPLDYAFLSGQFLGATVHLVFLLAALRIVTAQATRDHIFVAAIAFMELLAASVLSGSLSFFVFLALFLVFGVGTLASAEIRRSIHKPRAVARNGRRAFHFRLALLTVSISVGILVLTAGLFFLLPRTAQAAFQHIVPQRYHIPGFSNNVVLGEIGRIQQRSTPVMHVRFHDSVPPAGLKWRGNALSQFDGRRWYNPPEGGELLHVRDGLVNVGESRRPGEGRGVSYEVHLNSIASDVLFLAGTPARLRIDLPMVMRTSTGAYRTGMGSADGLRYGAYAYLDPGGPMRSAYGAYLSNVQRIESLILTNFDLRIMTLAREITASESTDEGRARAIEVYLRQNYGYTSELLSRAVADPLAHFLFERREGHCEYFASAMAVMLRSILIPARVATGFQSGVYNPVSGWWVVRASDAHSWVEAWIPGRGWTTFDPTPPDPNAGRLTAWSKLGLYVDAAQTFWREWVLNYDLPRQVSLAFDVEQSGRSLGSRWLDRARRAAAGWGRMAEGWGGQAAALLLASAVLVFTTRRYGPRARAWWVTRQRVREVQRGAARASDATLLYARMLTILQRRGLEKPAWLTPSEFARLLPPSPAATVVEDFTVAYNDLRFGGNPSAAPRMVGLLAELENSPSPRH